MKNSELTAKDRQKESLPTRWLFENGYIKGQTLDYGCGLGKDVEYLNIKGINTQGYDPYYFPVLPEGQFDTIICHYVLNVLKPLEQSEVIMSISEKLKPSGSAFFTVRRDLKKSGLRLHTVHNEMTFQTNVTLPFFSLKRFEHSEIYEYRHYNQLNASGDCIFCHPAPDQELLTESARVYSILDKFPVTSGHALIIPKTHVADFFKLTIEDQMAMQIVAARTKKILDLRYHPNGYNLGINVGKSAGQTIMHVHMHLIPRYEGDVENPIGGVRNVIPEKGDYLQNK